MGGKCLCRAWLCLGTSGWVVSRILLTRRTECPFLPSPPPQHRPCYGESQAQVFMESGTILVFSE